MSTTWEHQKLEFPRPRGWPVAYADLYRLGRGEGPAPALVYVGGAAPVSAYLERRHSAPDPVAAQARAAWMALGLQRLDLLVCPCPVNTWLDDEDEDTGPRGQEWMVAHLDRDLLPALGPPPTTLGFVGYSAGAAFALYLGAVYQARAVATLGGAGLIRLLIPPPPSHADRDPDAPFDARRELAKLLAAGSAQGWAGLELGLFRNTGDQADAPADIARHTRPPLVARPQPAQPGGHEFEHYAANGVAAAAFGFVLRRLG